MLNEIKSDEELFISQYLAQEKLEEDTTDLLYSVQADKKEYEEKIKVLDKVIIESDHPFFLLLSHHHFMLFHCICFSFLLFCFFLLFFCFCALYLGVCLGGEKSSIVRSFSFCPT